MAKMRKDESENSGADENLSNKDRRQLMKLSLGAGIAISGVGLRETVGQAAESAGPDSAAPLPEWGSLPWRTRSSGSNEWLSTEPRRRISRAGYKNNANRASGNGPMDDITRQVIEYAGKFWNSTLPASTEAKVNDVMLDAMACVIAGCDSDAVRAAARVARMVQASQ